MAAPMAPIERVHGNALSGMIYKRNRSVGRTSNIPNHERIFDDYRNQTAGSRTTGKALLVFHLTSQLVLALELLAVNAISLRGSHRRGFYGADIQFPDDNVSEIGLCGHVNHVWKEAGNISGCRMRFGDAWIFHERVV